ncbi:uncharacterized protein LOC129729025 [Wyeomyia smithii]|uniref:uncharacterized protein LOC129729025 n=1 Tax=Wyeomyia smithii TaxID=174621 RepID=UPI002467C251|nr:uncharacterized protein LOC129729025 [Wyeomyia smithii]
MKQQQIRQESLERMQLIIRQMSECGSKTGSVHDPNRKVSDWLTEIHSDVFDTESESGKADPLPELKPPVPVIYHLNPDCANPSDQYPNPSTPPGVPKPIDQASNCTAQPGLPLTTPSVSIPLGSSPLPKSLPPISEVLPGISKPPRQQPVSDKPPIPRRSLDNPGLSDQPATMTDKPCQRNRKDFLSHLTTQFRVLRIHGIRYLPMSWWPPGFPSPFVQRPAPPAISNPLGQQKNSVADNLPANPSGPVKNPSPNRPLTIPRLPPKRDRPTDPSSIPPSRPACPTPSVVSAGIPGTVQTRIHYVRSY